MEHVKLFVCFEYEFIAYPVLSKHNSKPDSYDTYTHTHARSFSCAKNSKPNLSSLSVYKCLAHTHTQNRNNSISIHMNAEKSSQAIQFIIHMHLFVCMANVHIFIVRVHSFAYIFYIVYRFGFISSIFCHHSS